jgi:hypothetical protein
LTRTFLSDGADLDAESAAEATLADFGSALGGWGNLTSCTFEAVSTELLSLIPPVLLTIDEFDYSILLCEVPGGDGTVSCDPDDESCYSSGGSGDDNGDDECFDPCGGCDLLCIDQGNTACLSRDDVSEEDFNRIIALTPQDLGLGDMSSMMGGGDLPNIGDVPIVGNGAADVPVVGDAMSGAGGSDEASSGVQDTVEQVGGMVSDATGGMIDALGGGS